MPDVPDVRAQRRGEKYPHDKGPTKRGGPPDRRNENFATRNNLVLDVQGEKQGKACAIDMVAELE